MASAKLVCALLLWILLSAPMLNVDALSCGVVAGDLAQCLTYLKKGGRVPLACCKGVKALKNAAKTTQDRRDACNCLKQTASKVGGVNAGFAAALPRICGVNIPYKFSTSTNCARLGFLTVLVFLFYPFTLAIP
ncbi:non-specific lipid-transfer protein 1-like [Populus alba x Populus x berolinensis]|uniref:Non-specific lipid-transfer protein n=2 Tax=Populus TaxID=3689 RepID=A0A4U5QR19_POPAL|nr:non-specific lipid-transfer protein 1-like [Populus alba x Populus x berolinensis]TKS13308.1 non-specific lipid-transfer protein 1-like [Populus alba]